MEERRRHVRAKPTPELPAHVLQEIAPAITEALDVLDISVSGLALVQGMKAPVPSSTAKVRLVLRDATHPFVATIRWVANGIIGIELVDPPDDVARAIRAYVAELLERGG
jgi:hypothetical protein